MLPLATHCHTHYHLHPFYFVLFKFKVLVAKQHPSNTHTCTHTQTHKPSGNPKPQIVLFSETTMCYYGMSKDRVVIDLICPHLQSFPPCSFCLPFLLLLPFLPSSLPSSLPPSLPPFLPPFLPPSLSSSLPLSLPSSLPPSLPSCLPPPPPHSYTPVYSGVQGRTMKFCQTKQEVNELVLSSAFNQVCQILHGDIFQRQREITLKVRCNFVPSSAFGYL